MSTLNTSAVFLTAVITGSYRAKLVVLPLEIFHLVAMLLYLHAPEIEIFQETMF